MAEELGFEQRLGNRRAVDGDKRRVGARAQRVQRAGEELLAGPALALEEHRRVRRRRPLQAREHFPQRQVVADQLRRAAPDRELLLEQQVLGHHPALFERARDEQGQVIGIDGLGEKIERAFFHRGDGILDAPVRRHDDHRDVGVELLRRAQHAEPIALGEPQVREHDGRALLEHPHGLGLIARLEHGMSLPLERVPEHRTQRVLVFDDQNLGGSGHSGGSQRSQPGGTPALRASSSMSAICFLDCSMSAFTRSSSSSAFGRIRRGPLLADRRRAVRVVDGQRRSRGSAAPGGRPRCAAAPSRACVMRPRQAASALSSAAGGAVSAARLLVTPQPAVASRCGRRAPSAAAGVEAGLRADSGRSFVVMTFLAWLPWWSSGARLPCGRAPQARAVPTARRRR